MPANVEIADIGQTHLVVNQPEGGYRYTIDPILLAFFVSLGKGGRVVDFGSGVGIIGIILASIFPDVTVSGIEIQGDLHNAAVENIKLNSLCGRVESSLGDFKKVGDYFKPSYFAAAVSNPPYYTAEDGRIGRRPGVAVAKHGVAGGVEEVIKGSSVVLKKGGSLSMIFPARKYQYLTACLESGEFSTRRVRFIHSKKDSEPKTVMVEAVLGESSFYEVMDPLIVYDGSGEYSDEVGTIFKQIGAI